MSNGSAGGDHVGYFVSCFDMGVTGCDHILHGETQEELLEAAIEHGRIHAQLTPEELVTHEFCAFLRTR